MALQTRSTTREYSPITDRSLPGGVGNLPRPRLLIRRYVEFLTFLTILFVVQTGLVPYDFLQDDVNYGSAEFLSGAAANLITRDIVSNVFLYLPLGVLLHGSLAKRLRSRGMALIITVIFAGAMSLGIEWIQSYSLARVSSLFDLLANIGGALLGASLAWIARLTLPRILADALVAVHEWPRTALLRGYVVALIIFAAMPFSFSFTSSGIKKAVKSTHLIPFELTTLDEALADDVLAKGDYVAQTHLEWRRMKRWSSWTAETVSFVLLAWLLQIVLRGDYGFTRGAAFLLACWIGCGIAIGLSAMQFVIVSRASDVTDVLFRMLGLGIGLITRWIYFTNVVRWERGLPDYQLRRLAKAGCALAAVFILYNGVIPLTFDAGAAGPIQSIESSGFLPFRAYFVARFDVMMDDVMEKFGAYAVFAWLFAFYLSPTASLPVRPRMKTVLATGVALSLVIEAVQMFMTVRITSLTDPLLALAGCLIGVITLQQMAMFHRDATDLVPVRIQVPSDAVEPLPPADALIASLTDPHPDAPIEPSRGRQPSRRLR